MSVLLNLNIRIDIKLFWTATQWKMFFSNNLQTGAVKIKILNIKLYPCPEEAAGSMECIIWTAEQKTTHILTAAVFLTDNNSSTLPPNRLKTSHPLNSFHTRFCLKAIWESHIKMENRCAWHNCSVRAALSEKLINSRPTS